MTIGIGVLATTEIGRRNELVPDTAILIADTLGSFGDVDSHGRLHKALMFPEQGLYAVVAGQVDKGAEILPVISKFLSFTPWTDRTYGTILSAIANACFNYKCEKFTLAVLPKLRLPPQAFDPRTISSAELDARIQVEWEKFDIGCDIAFAVFDGTGRAFLFNLNAEESNIAHVSFPGFTAVGSGADNAMFWLSRRQHTLGLLPIRAAYHAYEAKLMAEGSPHVNEHLDIIVATKTENWFCTTHRALEARKEHPIINMENLKRLAKKYGIRSTEKLGKETEAK